MLAFFCALPFDQSSNLIKYLETYIDASASYIVAMETSPTAHAETQGQHFHLCVDMDNKQYDTFRKTILVNKYKLQGQARNGIGRQYGKVNKIREETKMLQYTVKDQNIIYKNYDLKTIQELIENSYKRTTHLSTFELLMKHLHEIPYTQTCYTEYVDHIEDSIIDYYITNSIGKALSKNHLRSLTTSFLMYHTKFKNNIKIK